jgi:hypothetical protein
MTKGLVAQIVNGKGGHYPLCIIDFNIDIESGICSIAINAKGRANRDNACSYCYASYIYKKDPKAYRVKTIKESEFKKIANKYPLHILRFGKNFECGHKRSRLELVQALKYCVQYKIRPVVTSKLLEFDKDVADLVKAANGVIHISLGKDEDEPGAIAQGSTNEWRLEQAMAYKKYGCPTQVRIVADVTMPMNAFHKKAFTSMGGSHGVLLTPLHYTNKAHFESMRQDVTWKQAKDSGLFSYVKGDLRPNIIHDDWKQTKERCGIIASREYCNNCVGKIDFNKTKYKEQLIQLKWNTEPAV